MAIDTDDFIQNCLEDLRHPKKVYINKIPKNFEKNQIVEAFEQFGEVHQVNIIHRTDRVNNFAYVTFVDSKSAVATVNYKFLELLMLHQSHCHFQLLICRFLISHGFSCQFRC